MKLKFGNQYLVHDHTFAVGVNQSEVSLPAMVAGDAILLRRVHVSLDAASAAPSITGAGLLIFSVALTGKEQVSPADLLDLEDTIWTLTYDRGMTGAGALGINGPSAPVPAIPEWPVRPTRELHVFGHTANVTNAATTVLKFGLEFDVFTLTAAEQLAYLL